MSSHDENLFRDLVLLKSSECVQWEEKHSLITFWGEHLDDTERRSLIGAFNVFSDLGAPAPNLRVDGQLITYENIESLATSEEAWTFSFSKETLLKVALPDYSSNDFLFIFEESAIEYIQSLGAISTDWQSVSRVYVLELSSDFGSSSIAFLSSFSSPVPSQSEYPRPRGHEVLSQVHLLSVVPACISPSKWIGRWGVWEGTLPRLVMRIAITQMSLSLANDIEIDSEANIVATFRGPRKVRLKSGDSCLVFDENSLSLLESAVNWVYSERPDTRHQVLSERLSLDLIDNSRLEPELIKILESAMSQAKDAYAFAISERTDEYYSELRGLIEDSQRYSDLVSQKVRELFESWARDVLGVFIVVGVTLLTKVDEVNLNLLASDKLVDLFFSSLGIFFVIAYLFRSVIKLWDLLTTQSNIVRWDEYSRRYIAKDQFNKLFKTPLQNKLHSFYFALVAGAIIYISVATILINTPVIFSWLAGF